jgi:hypothetical protein
MSLSIPLSRLARRSAWVASLAGAGGGGPTPPLEETTAQRIAGTRQWARIGQRRLTAAK